VLAETRFSDQNLIASIQNAMQVYDRCRQNRNQVTHFSIQIALGEEHASGFNLLRKTKKPDDVEGPIPIDDSLRNLRRIAKEIWGLNAQLKTTCSAVFAKKKPKALEHWDQARKDRIAQLSPTLPLPKPIAESRRAAARWLSPLEDDSPIG
jgi:hypothetical protein